MTRLGYLDGAHCWQISGVRSAERFFGAIARLVPEATHLLLEGAPAPDVVALIADDADETTYVAPVGTLWSWPRRNQRFTLRASPGLFTRLAGAAAHHAEPEICSHLHLYRDTEPLVHWFDAFDDPLLVSKKISRQAVERFCAGAGGTLSNAAGAASSGADTGSSSSVWLALRSLLWTLLLPGFFAGYVPWRYFGLREASIDTFSPVDVLGLVAVGLGTVLLVACIFEFARSGRGTLSPVDPPRDLVVRGLYRYVRNPMYLSVTAIVLGEVLVTSSVGLAVYWAIWFVGANLFVIGYEEPTLRRQFGASYDEYTRQVGRWIPTFRPSGSRLG